MRRRVPLTGLSSRRMVLTTIERDIQKLAKQEGLLALDEKLSSLKAELIEAKKDVERKGHELEKQLTSLATTGDTKVSQVFVDISHLKAKSKKHEDVLDSLLVDLKATSKKQESFESTFTVMIDTLEDKREAADVRVTELERTLATTKDELNNTFRTLASSLKTHNEVLKTKTEIKVVDTSKFDSEREKLVARLKDLEEKVDALKVPKGKKDDWTIKTIRRSYDFRIKVSANDSREDFLSRKIVAGANVTVTELNDGGVRTLSIASSTPGTLDSLTVTNSFTVTNGPSIFNNGGGDFDFTIKGQNDDNLFKVDASADQIIIGTATALQTSKLYMQYSSTATSGGPYGFFVGLSFAPTSSSSALVAALGFSVQSSGSQTLSGQIKGIDAVVEHDGTGSLSQALGANFLSKKSNTGDVTVLYGANYAVGNTHASGSVVLGVGSQFAGPTGTGTISNVAGAYILNQGRTGVANSFGIYIDGQSGSSSINAAIAVVGGAIVFNNGQDGVSDFTVLGDTDANLLFVDVSADAVIVGASATADSAKFYVGGKMSTSGEVEINGDLNHDGSNVGFYATAPAAKQTVSGSRGGNAALASLLTALATIGLITDSSSA